MSAVKKKLLIILTGSLGDIVRALSLLPALQESKQWQVDWLVDSRWKSLLSNNPSINKLIVLERNVNLLSYLKTVKELRSEHYDVVFDLQRILKSGVLSLLTKSARRIGFNKANTKEFNHLFNNEQVGFLSDKNPKINYYHQFLEKINIHTTEPYHFDLDYLWKDRESLLLKSDTTILAVVLESSWESKNWFDDYYLKLVNLILSNTNYKIVLLGTTAVAELSQNIADLDSSRIENYAGRTNLVELVCLLRQANLAVGPDSGPGHLAAALSIPYYTIFGPTSVDRVAPYGAEKLAIEADLHCRPCYKKTCPLGTKECLKLLTPEKVFKQISSPR